MIRFGWPEEMRLRDERILGCVLAIRNCGKKPLGGFGKFRCLLEIGAFNRCDDRYDRRTNSSIEARNTKSTGLPGKVGRCFRIGRWGYSHRRRRGYRRCPRLFSAGGCSRGAWSISRPCFGRCRSGKSRSGVPLHCESLLGRRGGRSATGAGKFVDRASSRGYERYSNGHWPLIPSRSFPGVGGEVVGSLPARGCSVEWCRKEGIMKGIVPALRMRGQEGLLQGSMNEVIGCLSGGLQAHCARLGRGGIDIHRAAIG